MPARPFTRRRWLACAGGASALAACSSLQLVDAITPVESARLTRGIAFGPHPRQRLDVYEPAPSAAGPRAVVMFFYGGVWSEGARTDYRFVGEALAGAGFVAVLPDYRLYPEVTYPAFVDDGFVALDWVRANAASVGGDPERIVAMGHSAGAYNAAMIAFDARRRGPPLRGFVGLAGPYDFLPITDPKLRAIFRVAASSEAELLATQPVNYADTSAPPAFLATVPADPLVSTRNSAQLAARLRALGRPVEERVYAGLTHQTLVGVLAAPLRARAPVLEDVARFVRNATGDAVAG
jgi:acetyl esterase/lipase